MSIPVTLSYYLLTSSRTLMFFKTYPLTFMSFGHDPLGLIRVSSMFTAVSSFTGEYKISIYTTKDKQFTFLAVFSADSFSAVGMAS